MNLDAYFQRIKDAGSREPTLETLRRIHRAHMYTVPFENLDIHIRRPIVLDEARLFDKLVYQGRGGFCYEQNGVFSAVLRELGFDVTLLEARVRNAEGKYEPHFDHLTLLVRLDERWLVDVGFGDSFLEPLRFDDRGEQHQDGRVFRVRHDGVEGFYSQRGDDGAWHDEYMFLLEPRRLDEFSETCHYHQTSPESHFTQKRVCSMATPTGRITLRDNRLIVTENGSKTEYPIASQAEFHEALKDHFEIVIS